MDSKGSRKSKKENKKTVNDGASSKQKSQNSSVKGSKAKKNLKQKDRTNEEKKDVTMPDNIAGENARSSTPSVCESEIPKKTEIDTGIDKESASAGGLPELVGEAALEAQSDINEHSESNPQLTVQETPNSVLPAEAEVDAVRDSPELEDKESDPETELPVTVIQDLNTMRLDPLDNFGHEPREDDSSCAEDLTPVNEHPSLGSNLLNPMTASVRIQSDKEEESSSADVWWTAREDLGGGSDEGSLRATSALSLDEISDGLLDNLLSPNITHKPLPPCPIDELVNGSPDDDEFTGGSPEDDEFTGGSPEDDEFTGPSVVEKRDATTITDAYPTIAEADVIHFLPHVNGHKPESPTEVKGRKAGEGSGRRGSLIRGQSICEEQYSEDSIVDYLVDVQDGAEARLAARRQARAEAREIRMKELEKQQKESEENADKHYDMQSTDVVNRAAFRVALGNHHRPASHTHSLGSTSYHSSRRSSEESSEDGLVSMRDMRNGINGSDRYVLLRHEIKELEDKFRKSMVQNAQLDNEKSALTYHVELLKDKIEDLEEALSQVTREQRDKSRDCEQLKRVATELREQLAFLKYQLQDREQLIKEYGLVVVENEVEVDLGNGERETRLKRTLVTQETANVLSTLGGGSLDVRLKRVLEEKNELVDELRRLKLDLEEEQSLNSKGHHNHVHTNHTNGPETDPSEIHREVSKQMADYKYKIQKYEQEILALQAQVSRLDGQVNRFRSAADEAETREDDLKVEKRKLQRELREAQSRLDEVETTNSHLQKRLDKLKTAKSNLLKDL